MGYYTVWVAGPSPYSVVEEYDECNDIPGSFPGLTFDYIADVEEPGPAHHFATLPIDEFPFAIVTSNGQIVRRSSSRIRTPHSTVLVGKENMRTYLGRPPQRSHNAYEMA